MPALTAIRPTLEAKVTDYQRSARWLRIALVLAWAALIWWLSSQRGSSLPKIPLPPQLWNLGHVVAFGVLSALIILSFSRCTPKAAVIAVGLTALYGTIDELHQGSVLGRHMDAWDVASDTLGACLAACVLLWATGSPRAGRLGLLCVLGSAATVQMASL